MRDFKASEKAAIAQKVARFRLPVSADAKDPAEMHRRFMALEKVRARTRDANIRKALEGR